MKILQGQKALVTGASSGIGKGIAMALGQAGADVAVNYHTGEEEANEVVEALLAEGVNAMAVQASVDDEEQVQAMFEKIRQEFGSVDILVNNAGIQQDAEILKMTLEQWNKVIATNLTGSFLCAREAIREFKRRGSSSISRAVGKIIFISSVHEIIPWAGHVNYATSKGGMKLLMQSLAQEVAVDRIRVNSVAPGAIRTPINKESWNTSEAIEKLLKLIPYKRIGEVEDVAKAVVWLASDESDYVTGTTLVIDGGMSLYPGFMSGEG